MEKARSLAERTEELDRCKLSFAYTIKKIAEKEGIFFSPKFFNFSEPALKNLKKTFPLCFFRQRPNYFWNLVKENGVSLLKKFLSEVFF